ncbi:hypothetical protein E2562_022023 [Oryza meyeriana var. granulata]|uniref:Late embryogenesis abundant protein LEA-2 subgroup domain-containing protein n=1 Tax=Oryza meyeriana var. granulata TaxID=110450 RepID=A0A6G1ENJ5_9ORYZ|nr:hypothetical protein E2562_022023 [Oryza meyeriana var. granulata]
MRWRSRRVESALSDLWNGLNKVYDYLNQLGVPSFICGCVQFWTPLSLTFLLLWLIYRPDRFHPHVDSAVLADLQLAKSSSPPPSSTGAGDSATPAWNDILRYDLAVDLSFRNSHRGFTIRYLDVGATAFYGATKLGPSNDALPSFRQGPKNTTRETAAGALNLRVRVELTLMYKVLFKKDVFFYNYDCWIWFRPPTKAKPVVFQGAGTNCWLVK